LKQRFFFAVCFLVTLVVSVIIHIPISFALKYMPEIPGLSLASPNGTIWDGEAKNIFWRGDNFGHVRWQFQPEHLFQGNVNYHIRFGRESDMKLMGKGDVGYGFSGLYAENVVVSIPARSVLKHISIPLPVSVTGSIELSINEYHYAQPWCRSARGTLVWNESKLSSPLGSFDLGTVISDVECQENTLRVTAEHHNRQVAGGLNAELQSNMRYDVNAWFKPGAEFPSKMISQLKWLGNPDNKGEYPFTYAGKLN